MNIKYFDNAATTALDKDILDKMIPYFTEKFYNPSSLYSPSQDCFKAINESRERITKCINSNTNEIYFTSGGTESDNLAIKGYARANKKKGMHIITSCIEHPAILNSCKSLEKEGFEVTYLPIENNGMIKIDELKKAIRKDAVLNVECLITSDPDFFKTIGSDETKRFFKESYEFVKTEFGKENIIYANVHIFHCLKKDFV